MQNTFGPKVDKFAPVGLNHGNTSPEKGRGSVLLTGVPQAASTVSDTESMLSSYLLHD